MDWKAAAAYYEARLTDTLSVYRHAMSLAQLPQAEISTKLRDELNKEAKPARRQLERLKKREFRIAVVGLEKAGKSTFLNAWLQCDLLPAKAARCTFTTTQIYSVIHENEQRLEVQVKTEDDFLQLRKEFEDNNAQEDIRAIQLHEATLNEVRREGNLTITFTRLEDIKEPLKKYVADERYAHAVLEARLYTNKLAQAEGIVFYDVPGLNSGLAKHVDEAQKMLSDCDAVIMVQQLTSLVEKELKIIKFTEQGDRNVTVADKLFVFLSRSDSRASLEALQQHVEEAAKNWADRANLPKTRIVSGSAGAYLVLNGFAERQTQLEIGEPKGIEDKLKQLTGIQDLQMLKQEATGIPVIKDKIFRYINTERVDVLRKRCEASISAILEAAEEIYTTTKKRYPENPEEAKRFEEEQQRILFTEWWQVKWEEMKADLQDFYDASVASQDKSLTASVSVDQFRSRYEQVIEGDIQFLRTEALRKRDTIFKANSNPVFDRANANFRWREIVYADATKTLISISHKLANELKEQAFALVAYMTDLLWDSPLVKDRLIEDSQIYSIRLENSLKVLFLRFARPVAEALLRGPLDSDTRNEIVQALGSDIEIVDNYYKGDEEAYSVLKKYVKYGASLLFDPVQRRDILGIAEMAESVALDAWKSIIQTGEPQETVSFEVEQDIDAFAEYLRHALFDAAGFESYCIQEFKSLVDNFRDKEGTWIGAAQNEWMRGNPKLLAELPDRLRRQEINLEVNERLRQLGVALRKAQNVEV